MASRKKPDAGEIAEVNFSDYGDIRFMHLGSEWVQGTMKIDAPFDIHLEYIERMMVWLLFVVGPSVGKRHAMQLGLGAAALTKFCHKRLRMRTTAVEINPNVVLACRSWFKLPPDDKNLKIVIADAAREIKRSQWLGTVDALQVDVYDHEAAAPLLDSTEFYTDCRNVLTDDGCMTVNLFGRSSSYDESLKKIVGVFGAPAVWVFKPTKEGNTVVLAQRTARPPPLEVLAQRCEEVQTRWKIRTSTWLRMFNQLKA
jgi:spermidine synthase